MGIEPKQNALLMTADCLCRLNHRLQARVGRPEIPLIQKYFCQHLWLLLQFFEIHLHVVNPNRLEVPLAQRRKHLRLDGCQLVWILEPHSESAATVPDVYVVLFYEPNQLPQKSP